MKKLVSTSCASMMLSACANDTDKPNIGMANPASEYCVAQGGTLEIKKDKQGNEYGICHLPDGRVIEEWDFYHQRMGFLSSKS
ncbi:hypothetical protein EDC44_11236 [Cricetibacter osteomyelitidis]|uniref:Hemolysin n=1 Tax=Cricetibacter osteomyelitidis TaxID=1521931 RepID=A0A4R2SWW0_9PAST|nr:DUF333 domain-containing protein [Cricetibacter osteomyelitidis]TCP94977.1 hypothetical protein EDC44_11236 [Cricetibacter osteomyelitidis]